MLKLCKQIWTNYSSGNRTGWWISIQVNVKSLPSPTKGAAFHSHTQWILNKTSCAKYLGINITNNLSWRTHVDKVCEKANSTHAFLQRNIRSCPRKIKAQCFTTFVRPVLEYASAAWAPHHKSDMDKLEAVQRRAARFVMRDYHRTTSVTIHALSAQLAYICTLEHRGKVFKLVIMYKIHHRTVDVSPSHLIPSNTCTRGHNLRFVIPTASILVYQHAFFPSTIRMWNALPAPLVAVPSFEAFRVGLINVDV